MARSNLPIRRVKTAIFNGHRFRIHWRMKRISKQDKKQLKRDAEYLYGTTLVSPPNRAIYFSMDRDLHPAVADIFSTMLHESAHAAFPQQDEESVLAFEGDFTRFLDRVGLKVVSKNERSD